jgi:serine protease Do
LRDGRKFPATLRGADAQSDLAVVKIDTAGLPVAALADSAKVRVGEFAIAVGAPFELDFSVTFGHVSAKGRSNLILGSAGAAMDQEFIQTDASINPGNSGGPLFNLDGEVIGVNCLIRGMRTGIGFAVPSNLARQISDKLVAEGKFARPWLGVGIRALRDTAGDAIAKEVNDGVIVSSIQPDGPAAKSELKPGDIITAIEGKPVGTAQELRAEIRGKPIGQAVMLAVYRPGDGGEGKRMQVKVVLEEWVQTEPILAQAGVPGALANELGLTVHPLTRDMASRFGVELKPGVLVILVEDESVAARKGIQPGDIITAVNQEPVANLEQFRDALAKAEMKKGITLSLLSGDKRRTLVLKNSRD